MLRSREGIKQVHRESDMDTVKEIEREGGSQRYRVKDRDDCVGA